MSLHTFANIDLRRWSMISAQSDCFSAIVTLLLQFIVVVDFILVLSRKLVFVVVLLRLLRGYRFDV